MRSRPIAMSVFVSVCLCICLFLCLLAYLENHTTELYFQKPILVYVACVHGSLLL